MMDLDSYAPFFQGVSDENKAMMIGMLNQKGFYPGDDRRNYVGLGGNQWYKPGKGNGCLLYTSPSPRDRTRSRMPSSA